MGKSKQKRNKGAKKPVKMPMAEAADRHVLYEAAVQCVESEIDFVDEHFRELRQRQARYLREDFCGTANTACEWVRRRPDNYATGIDLDNEVLSWGKEHHVASLPSMAQQRIALVNDDVNRAVTPQQDIILAMNFSYWLFSTRKTLLSYFKRVRESLAEDGVFFLDCFGGYDAFRVLKEKTKHKKFTYVWDQASYNPIDGLMQCHIHFHFPDGSKLKQAFSYQWRLWTLPEVRELLEEAGFERSIVYWQGWDEDEDEASGEFEAVETADADAGWIAYIAAIK